VHSGYYITVEAGIHNGVPLVANPFPVSWALESDDFEEGIWRFVDPVYDSSQTWMLFKFLEYRGRTAHSDSNYRILEVRHLVLVYVYTPSPTAENLIIG
jgi:hypothetical protein